MTKRLPALVLALTLLCSVLPTGCAAAAETPTPAAPQPDVPAEP